MIRRQFLTGLAAALAAPAVIRTPGLLMPVKPLRRLRGVVSVNVTISPAPPLPATRTIQLLSGSTPPRFITLTELERIDADAYAAAVAYFTAPAAFIAHSGARP